MGGRAVKFRHIVIDADPPGSQHDITLIADVNGDGRNDIVIGCKKGPVNLFWYENPSWTRHDMASAPDLEAGGIVLDVNGDGRLDVVAGQQARGKELYWFECPPDPRAPWTKRLIANGFEKYHDQAAGDVDGDGKPEIVFLSQKSGVLAYFDVPDDPRLEPWPLERCHIIGEGLFEVEGLAVADVDGDGRREIVAGTRIFRPLEDPTRPWQSEEYAKDFRQTRVAVADLDGDGRLEIVLAEGERQPARVAWCKGPQWTPRVLQDNLFHPHSLQIADFNGDGLPDIFVGEMGLGKNPDPRMIIYLNLGAGRFEETVFQRGVPTHEAKAGDLTGDGRPDIVGKPYQPERHIDVWLNES